METTSPLKSSEREALAKMLFPDMASLPAIAALEERYPQRPLPAGAMVTRVAPSPTGFAHIGFVYMSLINRRFAHQTGDRFLLRIEDTDTKREVSGATDTIISTLDLFDLAPDEGYIRGELNQPQETGNYGPYLQSLRKDIYRSVIHQMVRTGFAYPCFCTEDEISAMVEKQTGEKVRSGYYGKWAVWRDAPLEKIKLALEKQIPFVVRLRSFGDPASRITWEDGVKGSMALPENDLDIVILKSDGQSLYHLAHAVDDHFMRITHVVRGDEWVSSVPIHLQIFQALKWEHPHYSHLSTIQKLELVTVTDPETGEQSEKQSKRKLSKRKDPEANAGFYWEQGFPPSAVTEYLLNIANSDFEDWRRDNPAAPNSEFQVKIDKLSPSGALADVVKLASISKEAIARMKPEQIYAEALKWSQTYDKPLAELMERDPGYAVRCIEIVCGREKPAKRLSTWRDLRPQIGWLYDEAYSEIKEFDFPETITPVDRRAIIAEFLNTLEISDDRTLWFDKVKAVAKKLGFAAEMKEFKANPQAFKGNIGDVSMVLRVAVSGMKQSPDLYDVIQLFGEERLRKRLERVD